MEEPIPLEKYYKLREARRKAKEEAEKAEKMREETEKTEKKPNFEPLLKGSQVKLALINGGELKGVLEAFTRYQIKLKISENRVIYIYKHAIAFLEPC